MPELLLLSRWLNAVPDFLATRAPANATIGFIATASSIYPDPAWVDLDRTTLHDQGFSTVDLDLESLTPPQLEQALHRVDAVFVSGGNVFHLLGVLRRTATDRPLADAITSGLPYLGASAGAAIVGSDIQPLGLLDDPAEALPLDSTVGLGFVDGVVVPHADGLVGGIGRVNAVQRAFGATHRLLLLRDDQALLVSGDTSVVVPG